MESSGASRRRVEERQPTGWTVFAGVLLFIVGSLDAIWGLAGILNDEIVFVGGQGVIIADVTTWGWIHLVLGLIAVAAGVGILAQQTWANAVGLVIAFLSAMSSFAFMPYYPFWSIVILAFDVFVIWALCSVLAND